MLRTKHKRAKQLAQSAFRILPLRLLVLGGGLALSMSFIEGILASVMSSELATGVAVLVGILPAALFDVVPLATASRKRSNARALTLAL